MTACQSARGSTLPTLPLTLLRMHTPQAPSRAALSQRLARRQKLTLLRRLLCHLPAATVPRRLLPRRQRLPRHCLRRCLRLRHPSLLCSRRRRMEAVAAAVFTAATRRQVVAAAVAAAVEVMVVVVVVVVWCGV